MDTPLASMFPMTQKKLWTRALYAPRGHPLGYPGSRPANALVLRDGSASPLVWRGDGWRTARDDRPVDALLRTPLRARTAQIAFGANRHPANLAWKLRHYRRHNPHLADDVLMVPCTIPDALVVACNVGYWGYVYGALITAAHLPVLRGARCAGMLLFLDPDQLHAVHASEGVLPPGATEARAPVSCDVGTWPARLPNGVTLSAQFYALSLPFLSFAGRTPLPLAGVEVSGQPAGWVPWRQRALLDALIARLDLPPDTPASGATLARKLHRRAQKGERPQPLFDRLWQGIAEQLALTDAAGAPLRGNDHVPLLDPEQAWAGAA